MHVTPAFAMIRSCPERTRGRTCAECMLKPMHFIRKARSNLSRGNYKLNLRSSPSMGTLPAMISPSCSLQTIGPQYRISTYVNLSQERLICTCTPPHPTSLSDKSLFLAFPSTAPTYSALESTYTDPVQCRMYLSYLRLQLYLSLAPRHQPGRYGGLVSKLVS